MGKNSKSSNSIAENLQNLRFSLSVMGTTLDQTRCLRFSLENLLGDHSPGGLCLSPRGGQYPLLLQFMHYRTISHLSDSEEKLVS